ncbi:MAG: N-acetyltransferase [Natronomonas sp.]
MLVRRLEESDVPSVHRLQTHLSYAEEGLPEAAASGVFVGVVADVGEVVGYAIAFPGDEPLLSELVVAPEWRRQGIGRRLVGAVCDRLDADCLLVTTPEGAPAVEFYRDLGFGIERRIPGFYPDRDAVELRLDLAGE